MKEEKTGLRQVGRFVLHRCHDQMLQFEVLDWAPPSICLLTGILGNGNVPGMKSIKMFIRSHGLNVLIFAAALSVLGLGYAAFSSFGDYGEVTSVQSFGRK